MTSMFFPHYITIIWFVFCDIQNNQSIGKGDQPNTPYFVLDYPGYHKNLVRNLLEFNRKIAKPHTEQLHAQNWSI